MAAELVWNPQTGDTAPTTGIAPGHASDTVEASERSDATSLKKGARLTADNATRLIIYEPEYKLVICVEHQYALQNLERHLVDYHGGSALIRQSVLESYSTREICGPSNVRTPEPLGRPFAYLGKPIRGLLCAEEECGFVSINRDAIRKHCIKRHDWRSTRQQREYWTQIWVQTFFKAGKQQYFSVLYSEEHREQDSVGVLDRVEIDLIRDGWQEKTEEHRKELETMEAEVQKQDKTGWFNRTGWADHLAKSNLKHLAHSSRLPDRDEVELVQATKLVGILIERGVGGLQTLHPETRRWLRSPKQNEVDTRPMARLQNHDSQLRYIGYWNRFICYCLRVGKRAIGKSSDVRAEDVVSSEDESESSSGDDDSSGSEYSDSNTDSNVDSDTGSVSREEKARRKADTLYDAERLFPWHGQQLDLAEKLLRLIQTQESEDNQVDAILELSKAFIFQKMFRTSDSFGSGLIHFLAVLGIDEEMGRLRTANDYSYMLAGMVYVIRIIAVEALLPSSERDDQGEAEVEHFLEQRKLFLADGSYGVMSTMISLLAYSKHLTLNHGNAGMIDWPSEEVMTLHGKRIYMARFRGMIEDVVGRAECLLWEELMWSGKAERFVIKLDGLEEDVTFTKRGHSFVDHEGNRLNRRIDWMLERMVKVTGSRNMRNGGGWVRYQVREYLRKVIKFKELLLFLVHLTGGQPGRGPEITGLRFRNGFLQDRNVFVVGGQVMTVTRYHKSQSQWDSPKVIPRFLPWRVGQLVVLYISHVQPFEEMLNVEIGGGWMDYIWANDKGPWETDRLTQVISRETAKGLGVKLNTHTYRHAAAAMGRKKVGPSFARGYQEEIGELEGQGEEEEEEDPNELAAGRGSAIGANRYGVSSSIVKHLSLRSMETFRPLCEKWHEFLGMQSYSESKKKRRRWGSLDETNTIARPSVGGRFGGMFAGFNARIANRTQGIEEGWEFGGQSSSSGRQAIEDELRHTDTPSDELPDPLPVLEFQSSSSAQQGIHQRGEQSEEQYSWTGSSPLEARDARERTRRRRRVSREELERAMCKALGQTQVSFRSAEQEEAMRAVMNGDTPLVVILPTGGGKSLLFMTPACLDKDAGMTIVVVPYRQLTNEFVKRANKLGVECVEWKHEVTDPTTLMVVSADMLGNFRFLDFASRMKTKGILRRVFVDECHLAFTANSWRPKLVHMKRVRHLQVPTIFLTATLPPTSVYEFEESLSVRYARYIRAKTRRKRTRYIVHECKAGKLQEEAVEACKRRRAHFRRGEKGVVYCKSRAGTEQVAEELDCGFVHAANADNEGSIKEWLDKGGFIVATSALGTGVDFPGIVFVLHVGIPYGMIDYAQESGRAGRAGEEVSSVIMIEEGEVERHEGRGRVRSVDEQAMVEYLTTDSCRRAVLGAYFDGEEADCEGEGGLARCDRCGEGEGDLEASERVMAEDREVIEETLNRVRAGCTTCWLADLLARDLGEEGVNWQHGWRSCELAKVAEAEVDAFRGGVRFERDTHSCHKCGFSQRLCESGIDNRRKCQWSNVAIAITMAACENVVGRGMIRRAGFRGELGEGLEEYQKWLGWRHGKRIWEEVMSNLMAVVLEFIIWSETVE